MVVTHKIKMDLVDKSGRSILDITQGDSIRALELELLEHGTAWQIPEDVHVIIRYDKSDGTGGCYDTLPDGTLAWQISGNKLSIALVHALCSTKGYVNMQIVLIQGEKQISTFTIGLDVEAEVNGGGEPEEYINLSKWLTTFAQKGINGKSAYEVAVDNGFFGTEVEWLRTLKGEPGVKGEDGETPVIFRPDGQPFTVIQMGGEVVAGIRDGDTPQKGLDYWTEDDKAEMVADVIAALPVYNGEVV